MMGGVAYAKGVVLVGWQAHPSRAFKRAARQAHREVVRFWWSKMLPEHFRRGADVKYSYTRRQRGYAALKKRRGVTPLVFRGHLRRATKVSPKITATPKLGKVRFLVTRYAFSRIQRKDGRVISIVDELKAVTQEEIKRLGDFLVGRTAELMNQDKTRREVKV